MSHGAPAAGFGGFVLGELALALPMGVLREVVPCTALQAMAASAPGLAGGCEVRGVLVPVLDLRAVLDPQAAPPPAANVVLAVHQGLIVGLLADAVSGVFTADDRSLRAMQPAGAAGIWTRGSVCRPDGGGLCNVVDVDALLALPGLPQVADPEPARAAVLAAEPDEAGSAAAATPPLMLIRCSEHGPAMAVDAMIVHAAVPEPRLQASPLAGGACLGVIEHLGERLPAVDLAALCGLGAPARTELRQAFVVQLPAGRVALLIGCVDDVVRAAPEDLSPAPAIGLPRPALFRALLHVRTTGRRHLVLDNEALLGDALLQSLAQAGGARAVVADPAAAQLGLAARSMITYELDGETATPIGQVREILAYQPVKQALMPEQALLDIVVERGRSIPVMCLSRLTGLPPPAVTPAVSVLVVEAEGACVGFAVPRLCAIEPAEWEPAVRLAAAGPARPGQLALVGQGAAQRMLHVVDLQALAGRLLAEARGRAAA